MNKGMARRTCSICLLHWQSRKALMMSRLSNRVDELERSQGRGTHCLLYTDAWSEEQLAAEVARLKQTYASVMTFLVDEDDLAGLVVPMTTNHEDALKELN